jgi:hypothetical protein
MRNVKDIISLPFRKIFLSVKDSFELEILGRLVIYHNEMYIHLLCNFKNLYIFRALNETNNILILSRLSDPIY